MRPFFIFTTKGPKLDKTYYIENRFRKSIRNQNFQKHKSIWNITNFHQDIFLHFFLPRHCQVFLKCIPSPKQKKKPYWRLKRFIMLEFLTVYLSVAFVDPKRIAPIFSIKKINKTLGIFVESCHTYYIKIEWNKARHIAFLILVARMAMGHATQQQAEVVCKK